MRKEKSAKMLRKYSKEVEDLEKENFIITTVATTTRTTLLYI